MFSFKEVLVKFARRRFPVDLIALEMVNYSMILGMGWLSKYNAPFLCRRRKVVFQPFIGEMAECKGTPRGSKWLEVSVLKASRILFKGCDGYLASIVDTTKKVATELVDLHVVYRFLDVFPEELTGITTRSRNRIQN